jgi:hypothetical protein
MIPSAAEDKDDETMPMMSNTATRVWTWNRFAVLEPVPPVFLMIRFKPVPYYRNRFAFKAGA